MPMPDGTFVRLQQSEGVVAQMASRLLAAHIVAGRVSPASEHEVMEKCVSLAVRLAQLTDRAIESDDENADG